MGIILWIVFGALVGWVASMVMGSGGNIVSDIVVGIIGSVIGVFLLGLLGQGVAMELNFSSFLTALLGACVLIAIVRAIRRSPEVQT